MVMFVVCLLFVAALVGLGMWSDSRTVQETRGAAEVRLDAAPAPEGSPAAQ